MKLFFQNIYHSFAVQLFILHFRKYQILLLFWWLLVATINGNFLKNFGADSLVLAPEYLGRVNILGSLITGLALGVFIMSWHVTTFILHSKRFKFLATTSQPFLKYCINNSLIPLVFLIFYAVKMYQFNDFVELMEAGKILSLIAGIFIGIMLIWAFSFAYFFTAEKRINKNIAPLISDPRLFKKNFGSRKLWADEFGLKVSSYFTSGFKLRTPRPVGHYRQEFIDLVFKRHHFAAIISIVFAFIFLVAVGFLLENKYFEMPAAASVLVFFAIMIAFIGSLTYFLESWSILAAIAIVIGINFLYKAGYIDPRNKAYGLNYTKADERPIYDPEALKQLCKPEIIEKDKENMIAILNKWKAKQSSDKPVMFFINVTGGGLRSAAFVMNTLQQLDSLSKGELLKQTFLISGASGGMFSATYYRELYRLKQKDNSINLTSPKYLDDITGDLLNPIFSSMIARDLFSPAQKFAVGKMEYVKDRGYALERKLAINTHNILNYQLKDRFEDEYNAKVPLIIFNSVIKRDGRKVIISTQPMSFMMKPYTALYDSSSSPDAVDFGAYFSKLDPMNLRVLSALRMNATFPYILPNVWLPTKPVIDVMDAGLRDNFGSETTLRFIQNFSEWIKDNTGGVVILQIRDKAIGSWQQPFETNSLTDMIINPATVLQHNWYKFQDYSQNDDFSFYKGRHDSTIQKISIVYFPEKEEKMASLNFHLSERERRDVQLSFFNKYNQESVRKILIELNT
ncbi:MAG: hypothetical protein ABIP68_02095 [Ferruginibacter sp.]